MTNSLEAYRPAARATPALVGRKRILEQIRSAIEGRTDTVVLYIHGDGGIGKTRLLTEVLRLCHDGTWKGTDKPLLAVEEPVDLYHTPTHVLEGLVRAMGAVLMFTGLYIFGYNVLRTAIKPQPQSQSTPMPAVAGGAQ